MKLITLIQAGALVLLAVIGAYASTNQPAPPCDAIHAQGCEL